MVESFNAREKRLHLTFSTSGAKNQQKMSSNRRNIVSYQEIKDKESNASVKSFHQKLINSRLSACGPNAAKLPKFEDLNKQEGQHPLTGQRVPPISGGTYRRRRTLIDGYLESPFPTACLL